MASTSSSKDKINLICESGEKIIFSRFQIRECSPLLKNMLENGFNQMINLIMIDENYGKLTLLRRYLVQKNLKIPSLDKAFDLYKMAKFYLINGFVLFIRNFIKEQIDPITVCRIYDFAYKQLDRLIQYDCWKKFDEKCNEVLQTREFSACQESVIDMYVTRPKYRSLQETTLFKYIVGWVERKVRSEKKTYPDPDEYHKRIRHYLDPFIKKIRFLSMELEELPNVFSYNVLSKEETENIYRCVQSESCDGLPNTICENRVKRIKECYRNLIVYKYRHSTHLTLYRFLMADSKLCCRFTPTEECFLYEIILPILSRYERMEVNIKITVENSLFQEVNNECTKKGNILLSEPLFLHKNIEYFLFATVDIKKYNYPIRIASKADFYIEGKELSEVDEGTQNQYFVNIRLYF